MKGHLTALPLLLALAGCRAFVSPDPAVTATPDAPRLQSPHASEHEWIGDAVVRDLAEMAVYAKTRSLPPPAVLRVRVKQAPGPTPDRVSLNVDVALGSPTQTISEVVALADHLWSPADYEATARRMLEVEQLGPPAIVAKPVCTPASR